MRRLAMATATLALLGAGPAGAVPAPAVAGTGRATALVSTGYILAGGSDALVAREAHALGTLGVDGVSLDRAGTAVSTIDPRLVATAHAHGIRAELLLSNYSDRIGDFDPKAAARLLRAPAHVDAVATQLAAYVATQGWDGIQVDLESLAAADADGLLALVDALQTKMPPDRTVSIAVMASGRASEYVARGYRLAELGQAVDVLALMTYDQHGTWSGAGPIGALSWQRRAIGVVTSMVPAAKVDLGVAGYGYTWPRGHPGRTVTDAQARRLVARDGARSHWRAAPGEWTARLSDGTRIWWSDGRSIALRQQLATELGLHGIALWRLGAADPLS